MNRYETNSKGTSPALSALNNTQTKQPRSAFDLSRRKSFDASPFAIIPVEVFPMLPNSDLYISYDVQAISKNPTIRRILSSMSVELRTYYIKNSDCWEGWNNFITRGRSGKLDMKIPTIKFTHNSGAYTTGFPYNPAHYLNIAPAYLFDDSQSFDRNNGILSPSRSETIEGETIEHVKKTGLLSSSFDIGTSDVYSKGISALPFVFYNKICKQYQNSNLLQENKDWYPENENHDNILPYSATEVTTSSFDNPTAEFGTGSGDEELNSIQPTNDKHSMPWLNVLYYRQRKGNQFNTGSPFADLLRGDVPNLEVLNAQIDSSPAFTDHSNFNIGVLSSDGVSFGTISGMTPNVNEPLYVENNQIKSELGLPLAISHENDSDFISIFDKFKVKNINFNLNAWRKLVTLTVFRERMARTDGSYNEMIQAQFNYNPKWHEHDVIYCGGSYQPIVFSEVVQQSENGSTPLGTTAGRAVTAKTNNSVTVHSNDYGMVMTVLTIVPDDYYSQGLNRLWTNLDQSTQYFPIMNNLEPTAILNKELFISGTDSTDDDVFNYQELFFEYKSRLNEISGLMALPIEKIGDTGAYIFNRLFNSTPQFNNAFVTGKMTDNENLCFASTEQAQFIFSIASMAKFVAPLPAVTQPSDMGISY